MGHKVHPTGIRLGISKDWNSKWYAGKKHYADYLEADLKVREMLRKKLAAALNGHALAEELVLYPALGQAGEKMHAAHAYLEQTTTKAQMAELENIAPSKTTWLEKWAHIEGSVLTHMFEEESDWFPPLKAKCDHQVRLASRYAEEFERYAGAPQSRAA